MEKHYPYQIHYIYLNSQYLLPELDTNQKGIYLVFWWKEIALGQYFLNPNEKVTEDKYYKILIEAIDSTIDFYSKKHLIHSASDWKKWIHNRNIREWLAWMENLFLNQELQVIPLQVPVSVIICTRNRSAFLHKCLFLLIKSTCLPSEIIVIDNAPIDNTTFETVQQFNEVIYIKEPRKGLDIARNTGILNAKYPIIAYLDDDVVVHPMWLLRVYETFLNPEVAAMAGLVMASQLETAAQLIFEKNWSFNRGYVDKVYDANYINKTLHTGPPVWEIGAGANMAFRKSIFQKVGLFDELLDVGAAGCNGDSEMWYRILIHGFNIQYNPRAIVNHEHRKEMSDLKKQIFSYMRGHTAAALLQQQQQSKAGYRRYIYIKVPQYYFMNITRTIKNEFPYFRLKHSTLWAEIRGVVSGLAFYYKNRSKSTRLLRAQYANERQ